MFNLFQHLPDGGDPTEHIDTLIGRPGLRIERIVSTGQASQPGFWYDQAEHEWVLVLQGAARLTVERPDGVHAVHLAAGDSIELPAHCRHRVEHTQAHPPTVWLAVFWPA